MELSLSLFEKLKEIQTLQLSDLELQILIGHPDLIRRVDFLVQIKLAIEASAPPHPDAIRHFFQEPNSHDIFERKSVKGFLLNDPKIERFESVFKFYMGNSV